MSDQSYISKNIEIINPRIVPSELYQLDSDESQITRFSILKFRLDEDKNDLAASAFPSTPLSFFGTFKPSTKRTYTDFLISENSDRFINSKQNQQKILEKLDDTENVLNSLKESIENYPLNIDKYFKKIKDKIHLTYTKILGEFIESKNKLSNELDIFKEDCARNVGFQGDKWNHLIDFIKEHQIDTKTIDFYLSSAINNNNSLLELKKFDKALDDKRNEFNSLIFMNKNIQYKPVLSNNMINEPEQYGILKSTQHPNQIADSFDSQSNNALELDRLQDFIFSKKTVKVVNGFVFDKGLIENQASVLLTIYSIGDHILICNRYMIKEYSKQYFCDFYLFDLTGNFVKKFSINSCINIVCTNSSSILTIQQMNNEKKSLYLNLYNADLEIIKINRVTNFHATVELNALSCCYDNNKFYIITNVKPFLYIYDDNLNLLTNSSLNVNPFISIFQFSNYENFFVRNQFLYLKKEVEKNLSYLDVVNLNTGLKLKQVKIPFQFTQFNVISEESIIFFIKNTLICFDLNKENVKHKIEFSDKRKNPEKQLNIQQVYHLTKHGFIITISDNELYVY